MAGRRQLLSTDNYKGLSLFFSAKILGKDTGHISRSDIPFHKDEKRDRKRDMRKDARSFVVFKITFSNKTTLLKIGDVEYQDFKIRTKYCCMCVGVCVCAFTVMCIC